MKKLFFVLGLLTFMLINTACKQKNCEFWVSYDPIDAYKEPSYDSEVQFHMRGTYHAYTILEKDSSGKWGRVESQVWFKKVSSWLPLEKMIYAGSNNSNEQFVSAVVKPDKTPLYRHPKEDREDSHGSLNKDDTVQITARADKWAHIRYVFIRSQEEGPIVWHGWVPLAQLKEIGTMSMGDVEQYQEDKLANEIANKTKGKYKPFMAKLHPFYGKMYRFAGKWALGMVVLLLIPSFHKKLFWRLILFLPLASVVTYVGMACSMPSWYFAFLIPFVTLIYCYPLLYYKKTSMISVMLYLVSTLVMSVLYYYNYYYFKSPKGSIILAHILLFLLLVAICVFISLWIYLKIDRHICNDCGCYANHPVVAKSVLNSTIETGTHTVDEYVGTTERTSGWTKVITRHYKRHVYDTEEKRDDCLFTRQCMSCGHTYQYEENVMDYYKSTER